MNLKAAQLAWEQLQIQKVKKVEAEKKIAEEFVHELQLLLHEKNVRIEQLEDELKQKSQPIVNNYSIHIPSETINEQTRESLKPIFNIFKNG